MLRVPPPGAGLLLWLEGPPAFSRDNFLPLPSPNLDGAILVPPPAAPLGFSGMRGGVPVKLPLGPLPQLRANANKRPAPVAPSSSPVGIAGKVRISPVD